MHLHSCSCLLIHLLFTCARQPLRLRDHIHTAAINVVRRCCKSTRGQLSGHERGLVILIGLVCMTSLLGLRGFNQSSMSCPSNYPDMLPDVYVHELSCCDLDDAAPLTSRSNTFCSASALGVTFDIFARGTQASSQHASCRCTSLLQPDFCRGCVGQPCTRPSLSNYAFRLTQAALLCNDSTSQPDHAFPSLLCHLPCQGGLLTTCLVCRLFQGQKTWTLM